MCTEKKIVKKLVSQIWKKKGCFEWFKKKSNYNISNLRHINKSIIKFIWKFINSIFEIIINLIRF
jgi:hypothetical protein